MPTRLIGFTGGEPFMNPEIIGMLEDVLSAGCGALVLTNAMKPMRKLAAPLLALRETWQDRLRIRVSLDHYTQAGARGGAREAKLDADNRRPVLVGTQRICD